MPEAKLRKTLKELGIPHHGDKHAMQARHSEWVTMYRANEDSSQPKPHTKLLVDLVRWEQAVMAGGSDRARTASASRAQPSPSSSQDSSVPAAGAANVHVEKYASSFAELVSQARSRLPAGAVRKTQ
ncbi:E3 ubiquitin-protein ligase rad18, partial [Spiromyces aspiralis]